MKRREFIDIYFQVVIKRLDILTQEVFKMAVDQKALDADLQTLLANVAVLINETNLLIAKVNGAVPPAPDFTSEDTGINSANSSVATAIANAKVVTGQ